jgi:POT family proton-dependent oligopeptide transporter
MAETALEDAPLRPRSPDLFGHPKGLWVLAGTELWDRISFHGMQALLTLYMAGELLLPGRVDGVVGFAGYRAVVEGVTGPLSVQGLAAQTFGLYVGLVSFTPVFGGLIGDRWLGRRNSIALGALLMTAGHFALAFDASFLVALLLLILGAGFLRGNVSAQLRSLYPEGDRRAADAFQVYFLAINMGAFIAPLVTGGLQVGWGWHPAFAAAGFGMLIGLLVYLWGTRHLPPDPRRAKAASRGKLTPHERARIIGLALVWPIAVCFWLAQSQVWNVYNLWLRDHADLEVGGFTVPVPWLSSLDGLAPAVMTPLVILWWRRQAKAGDEPDLFVKLATGCLIFAAGVCWLALASWLVGDEKVNLLWPVGFHLISNLGWIFFAPIALALFAAQAPLALRGTLIGINTLSVFAASVISGRIGGLYETLSPTAFWLVHAAIVGAGGLVMLMAAGWFRRWFERHAGEGAG